MCVQIYIMIATRKFKVVYPLEIAGTITAETPMAAGIKLAQKSYKSTKLSVFKVAVKETTKTSKCNEYTYNVVVTIKADKKEKITLTPLTRSKKDIQDIQDKKDKKEKQVKKGGNLESKDDDVIVDMSKKEDTVDYVNKLVTEMFQKVKINNRTLEEIIEDNIDKTLGSGNSGNSGNSKNSAKKSTLPNYKIVNKNSKFVVITYWWGRGNDNKNLQVPCPELVKPGQSLIKPAIRFETMIETWKAKCIEANCNYFVVECPEFAKRGGYQLAINAKPIFISKAIDAIKTKSGKDYAVVYIDGDMTINTYPEIFDMPDVDFMARGWNIDPRAAFGKPACFDPFIFETSGGIMYFANTLNAQVILKMWRRESRADFNVGKADDRILSKLAVIFSLSVVCNIIQLPIEYLWLTDMYTDNEYGEGFEDATGKDGGVIVEHPACLTGEERAADMGAANDRHPLGYKQQVEEKIDCERHGGTFHERIFFEKLDTNEKWVKMDQALKSYQPYLKYIESERAIVGDDLPAMYVHPYSNGAYTNNYDYPGFNKTNLIFAKNTQGINNFNSRVTPLNKVITVSKYDNITDVRRILENLLQGYHVMYVPDASKVDMIDTMKEKIDTMYETQLICFNEAKQKFYNNWGGRYYPIFIKDAPMLFSCSSRVLIHLLAICNGINDFQDIFRSSYLFITRIRCNWIPPSRPQDVRIATNTFKSYAINTNSNI